MAIVPPRLKEFWDTQHRTPSGLAGCMIGERMMRQHRPETGWTLALLEIKPCEM